MVISSVTFPMMATGGPAMPLTPALIQLPISLLKNLTNLFFSFLLVEIYSSWAPAAAPFFSSSAPAPFLLFYAASRASVAATAGTAYNNFGYWWWFSWLTAAGCWWFSTTDIDLSKPPREAMIALAKSSSNMILSRLRSVIFRFCSKSSGTSLKSMFAITRVMR